LRSSAPGLLAHGEILGFRPLRETVAAHVGLTRGVKCTADQVVITTGTQQSLDLISRLVLDPGDRVWMEDPGYVGATALLRAAGAEVIGVPVDAEGIDCDAGRRRFRSAKPIGAGLQVVGWLAKGIEENEACRRAAERGVDSVALSKLTIHRSMSPALVLGVACADIRAIRSGVERLGTPSGDCSPEDSVRAARNSPYGCCASWRPPTHRACRSGAAGGNQARKLSSLRRPFGRRLRQRRTPQPTWG
jgi:DNA-binding transcriptional MocR family regulator